MVRRYLICILALAGSAPVYSQTVPYLPFAPVSVVMLRSSVPIGDVLKQKTLSAERKQELNTQFQEISDSISRSSESGELLFLRGMIRMELGGMRGALDDFELARSKGFRKRVVYFNLGIVNAALAERTTALAYFNICLKKDSTDAEVHHYAGITKLYLKHGSAEDRCLEAIPEFSKAIQYDHTLRDAFILRGCAFDRLGQHQAALDDFKKALEMSPANPTIMMLIGQATLNNH